MLCIIGHAAYCSHLISHFEVFFSGSFVDNVQSLFLYVAESVHSVREEIFQSQEVAKRVPTERTGSVAP